MAYKLRMLYVNYKLSEKRGDLIKASMYRALYRMNVLNTNICIYKLEGLI